MPKVFCITSQAMSAAVSFAHKLPIGARLSVVSLRRGTAHAKTVLKA